MKKNVIIAVLATVGLTANGFAARVAVSETPNGCAAMGNPTPSGCSVETYAERHDSAATVEDAGDVLDDVIVKDEDCNCCGIDHSTTKCGGSITLEYSEKLTLSVTPKLVYDLAVIKGELSVTVGSEQGRVIKYTTECGTNNHPAHKWTKYHSYMNVTEDKKVKMVHTYTCHQKYTNCDNEDDEKVTNYGTQTDESKATGSLGSQTGGCTPTNVPCPGTNPPNGDE